MEGAHTGASVAVLLQSTQNIQGDTVIIDGSPSPEQSRSSKYLLPLYSSEKDHQSSASFRRWQGAGRREKGEQGGAEGSESEKEKCLFIHTRRQRQGVRTPQQTHCHREAGSQQ